MISTHILETTIHLQNAAFSALQDADRSYPSVSFGTHTYRGKTVHVLRISTFTDGKRQSKEFTLSTPKGQRALASAQKILLLRKALAVLSTEIHSTEHPHQDSRPANRFLPKIPSPTDPSAPAPTPTPTPKPLQFTLDEWLALSEWNDPRITTGYRHKNHVFRSKSELIIAQLLEALGLEYKYEPQIVLGGIERRPDFAVFCPETMRYFLIEHLGLLSDTRYRMDAITKMEEYDKAGIRDGLDIIYTSEFGQGSLDVDAAYGKISGIILAQSLHT